MVLRLPGMDLSAQSSSEAWQTYAPVRRQDSEGARKLPTYRKSDGGQFGRESGVPMIRHLQRIEDWTWEQIDASPSQFRLTLPPRAEMDDVIKLAVFAGKKMAAQLAKGGNRVSNLSREQIEEWRAKYAIPKNRVNVMLAIAWSTLRYTRRSVTARPSPRIRQLGTAENPRTIARQFIDHYGFKAERMARVLRKGNKKNRKHWSEVLKAIRAVREKRKLKAPAPVIHCSLDDGFRAFDNYLARQQKVLRHQHRMEIPEQFVVPLPKRLVSNKVAYSPTLCLGTDDLFHARCNRPVSGPGVFCQICKPKKERS